MQCLQPFQFVRTEASAVDIHDQIAILFQNLIGALKIFPDMHHDRQMKVSCKIALHDEKPLLQRKELFRSRIIRIDAAFTDSYDDILIIPIEIHEIRHLLLEIHLCDITLLTASRMIAEGRSDKDMCPWFDTFLLQPFDLSRDFDASRIILFIGSGIDQSHASDLDELLEIVLPVRIEITGSEMRM